MAAPPVPSAVGKADWRSLGTPASELRLEWTLPTGQSFRWRAAGAGQYMGVIGQRAVHLRQLDNDVQYRIIARGAGAAPAGDEAALADYFNLSHSLAALAPGWAAACPRYAAVAPHLPGARMLRQDPVECLFQFICSSNNHISRIHGMVERLCRQHGTPLLLAPAAAQAAPGTGAAAASADGAAAVAGASGNKSGSDELALYAFPTLEQLAAATEEQLRGDGFGYRAKYIVGSVQQLLAKPGGGAAWLLSLRDVPFEEAAEELCSLPGIGPKVAACICLFSLDKHEAIPVDTHVWELACRYYTPHLRSKALTPKLHKEVQAAFVQRFGPFAGWAHNSLFISELASTRAAIPALAAASAGGRSAGKQGGGKRKAGSAAASSSGSEASGSSSDAGAAGGQDSEDSWSPAGAPAAAQARKRSSKSSKAAAAAAAASALSPGTPLEVEGPAAAASAVRPVRRLRRRAP